jgi:hypothetical protein
MDANSNPSVAQQVDTAEEREKFCFDTCNETEIMDVLAFGVMPKSQSPLVALSPDLFRFLGTVIKAEQQKHLKQFGCVTPPLSPRAAPIMPPNAPRAARALLQHPLLPNSSAQRFLQRAFAALP